MSILKKNVWYPPAQTPPTRNEALGKLPMILLIGERIQEGYYSHEEKRFYAHVQRYNTPVDVGSGEVITSVDQINKALEWEDEEVETIRLWMLVDNPAY